MSSFLWYFESAAVFVTNGLETGFSIYEEVTAAEKPRTRIRTNEIFFFFFKFSVLMFRLCPLCVFVQSRRIQSCPETISVAFYLIVSVLWYFSKEKSNCLTYLLNYLHPPFGRGGLILWGDCGTVSLHTYREKRNPSTLGVQENCKGNLRAIFSNWETLYSKYQQDHVRKVKKM